MAIRPGGGGCQGGDRACVKYKQLIALDTFDSHVLVWEFKVGLIWSGAQMLEEISQDKVHRNTTSNQPLFDDSVDYGSMEVKRSQYNAKWKSLDIKERALYSDQLDYDTKNDVPNIKEDKLIPAKNYYLMKKEIEFRLNKSDRFSLLPVDALEFDEASLELVESIENISEIKELYKLRKEAVGDKKNSGISSDEAAKIKNCFSQGRELFIAGKNGSLMVKPLNFFYALTAYSYGIIILNNPIRYRKDMLPGSHGMSYLPAQIQAQFGGDTAKGTFSDLVCAFPTHLVKRQGVEFNVDCSGSLLQLYKNRFDVSVGTLLSMIPEMADYYKLTTGRNSRCHPLEIVNANDPRSLTWEFHIGDGEKSPNLTSVDDAFSGFNRKDRHGKIIIIIPASEAHRINACIYTDLRGKLWFVENPFSPILLPEIAVHFLITSMFSNIMRYRPDEWGGVLLNEVSTEVSLITRHYFSSFQRKFLLLVLRCVSRYIPYAIT